MISTKPYLIRAIYEWIIDNELTPYLVINAEAPDIQVPTDYIEDGRIVLNISPKACRGLHLENDRVVFSARFNGDAFQIFAPPSAVLAIYAKENGRGMMFGEEEPDATVPPPEALSFERRAMQPQKSKKPQLKLIKNNAKQKPAE